MRAAKGRPCTNRHKEATYLLKLATLASGSSGNCLLVSDGSTHVLIDAGISARRITTGLKALGVDPHDLSAVLITHEHSDHINGLPVLSKQLDVPICTAHATGSRICGRMPEIFDHIHSFSAGEHLQIGTLEVSSFPTLHDCACSVGYVVTDEHGVKMALATDLGTVTEFVRQGVAGARAVIVEANYDYDMLRWGPYPIQLKERILSDHGHLSNELGGELALYAVERGAQRVILGHLSKENNTPALAYETVSNVLARGGVKLDRDCALTVASRDKCDGWVEV